MGISSILTHLRGVSQSLQTSQSCEIQGKKDSVYGK